MYLPSGFITVCDAADAIGWCNAEIGAIDDFNSVQFLGSHLAAEKVKSYGWEPVSGRILPLPGEIWRRLGSNIYFSERRLHSIELSNEIGRISVIQLLKIEDLKAIFSAPSLLLEFLPKFDDQKWDFSTSLNDKVVNNPKAATTQHKNRGGAPEKYSWEDFWINAVAYAAKNGMETDEDFNKFKKFMKEWINENWSEQPEVSTVRIRFQKLSKLIF